MYRGRAVLVPQRTVDERAELLRLLHRGQPAVDEVTSQGSQLLAGAGERGCLQKARIAQRLSRKPGRAAIPDPLDHGGDPELDSTCDAVGPHPDDVVAIRIAAGAGGSPG